MIQTDFDQLPFPMTDAQPYAGMRHFTHNDAPLKIWLDDKPVEHDTAHAYMSVQPNLPTMGYADVFERDADGHIQRDEMTWLPLVKRVYGLIRWNYVHTG